MSLMVQDEFLYELLTLFSVLELFCHFNLIYCKAVLVIQPKKVFNTSPIRIYTVSTVQNTHLYAVLMNHKNYHALRISLLSCR